MVNWSRGWSFGATGGESATTNYKKQSTIAALLGTNATTGTDGSVLASVLNRSDMVAKPRPTWIYTYADSGTQLELFSKIVTDVSVDAMPLIAGVAPHLDSDFALTSWPNQTAAHHYVVISGYDGLIPSTAFVTYDDSAAGFNGGTGKFVDPFVTMWNVNKDNKGKIIW